MVGEEIVPSPGRMRKFMASGGITPYLPVRKAQLTLTHELNHWPSIAGMSPQAIVGMRRMGALDCLHDFTMFYAPSFLVLFLLSTLCASTSFCLI